MQQDPDMSWRGTFPYDVLAPAGVTPESTMPQILSAKGYFARTKSSNKEVNAAWGELTRIDSRLFYDFFLYRLDPVPAIEATEL